MIALNPLSFRIFTVYLNRALCIFAVCAAACTRPRRHGTDIAQLTLVRNICRDAKCHATTPIQCGSMRRRKERFVASVPLLATDDRKIRKQNAIFAGKSHNQLCTKVAAPWAGIP